MSCVKGMCKVSNRIHPAVEKPSEPFSVGQVGLGTDLGEWREERKKEKIDLERNIRNS